MFSKKKKPDLSLANTVSYNLVGALSQIDYYLYEKRSDTNKKYLRAIHSDIPESKQEIELLSSMYNQLQATLNSQSGWLKLSCFAIDQVTGKMAKKNYNQDELLFEMDKVHQATLVNVFLLVTRFVKKLDGFQGDFIYSKKLKNYLLVCFNCILKNIHDQAVIKLEQQPVLKVESVELRPPIVSFLMDYRNEMEKNKVGFKNPIQIIDQLITQLSDYYHDWRAKHPDLAYPHNAILLEDQTFFNMVANGYINLDLALNKLDDSLKKLIDNSLKKLVQEKLFFLYNYIKGIENDVGKSKYDESLLTRKYALNFEQYRKLAVSMGSRYIPFQQLLDPLIGGADFGKCYGYVKSWFENIRCNEKPDMKPVVPYSQTLNYQFQQFHYRVDTDDRMDLKYTKNEVEKNIIEILNKLEKQYVYMFCVVGSHTMGLRILSGQEVEFFDPNFGIVVFANKEIAAKWLAHYTFYIYGDGKRVQVDYSSFGKQPTPAKPSIPAFSSSPQSLTTQSSEVVQPVERKKTGLS